VPFSHHDDSSVAERLGVGNPFYTAEYDFVLVRVNVAQRTPVATGSSR
jgi:hypothetical protein